MTGDLPIWVLVLGLLAGLWIVMLHHRISLLREEIEARKGINKCN